MAKTTSSSRKQPKSPKPPRDKSITVLCPKGCGRQIPRHHKQRHCSIPHEICICGVRYTGRPAAKRHQQCTAANTQSTASSPLSAPCSLTSSDTLPEISPLEPPGVRLETTVPDIIVPIIATPVIQEPLSEFATQLARVREWATREDQCADTPKPSILNTFVNGNKPYTQLATAAPVIVPVAADPSKVLGTPEWSREGSPEDHPLGREIDKMFIEMRDCLSTYLASTDPAATALRRYFDLALVDKIFPAERPFPFATEWSPGLPGSTTTSCQAACEADFWVLSTDEFWNMCNEGVSFSKPILIPPPPTSTATTTTTTSQCSSSPVIQSFLRALPRHYSVGTVDVQDYSRQDKSAVAMDIIEVLNRIKHPPSRLTTDQPPINLLNLRGGIAGQAMPLPQFLNHERFDVIPVLNSHLDAQVNSRFHAGKRAQTVHGYPIDLASCTAFALYSQRGSWTGFHVDVADGTWVSTLEGCKLWCLPARYNDADRAEFESEGDEWIPKAGVRVIVLEPGSTLVMPPGPVIPHSVLTLRDTLMCGGMFFDQQCLLQTLENILWTVRHPSVTNEAVPQQLLEQWDTLRDLVIAAASAGKLGLDRIIQYDVREGKSTTTVKYPLASVGSGNATAAATAAFEDISQRMKAKLSCECSATKTCVCHETACPCLQSLAQDYRCTPWCHNAEKAASRRKRKR